ncbi:MAG: thioredoxin domain-containing protein [Nitrosomonas sp.]|nr:thioredoxin domain-containing protein [Nitrosomonas sp.]
MPNHLTGETSPYLQQHADNPVEWYPWGEAALQRARTENKPILLSIGYSACHWCHVMAHESFEDPHIAAVMNAHFINIKVDREERPDLDQIYQDAHYMLNHRSGGWPLTMFLTPDQLPFFGGTYFPKTSRHGMHGFNDLLPKVAELFHARQAEIKQQNSALLNLFSQSLPACDNGFTESRQPIDDAWTKLRHLHDATFGGFGDAPKFPHPAELTFCLRRFVVNGNEDALHVVVHTLEKMAAGGLYDQLGGGFCRYSTDRYWRIPHFEKMLYDNALLLPLYADAWLMTNHPAFQRVVEETIAWVVREMQTDQDDQGLCAFYSSIDADSEGEEGKFYVWTRNAVQASLAPEEYTVIALRYGLDRPPNFEQTYWHLEAVQSVAAVASQNNLSEQAAQALIDHARQKLLLARSQRIRPGRDEKMLTSWNALMIKGLARAGQVFQRPDWITLAQQATDFIYHRLWKDNRLLATFKDGKAHLNAYLDDHAFLLDALLTLIQARFRQTDLNFATALADVLLNQFEDPAAGGFFFTSRDHEKLIHRAKTGYDNAIPAGNGIAAIALQRLGHLIGEPRYLQAAERSLQIFSEEILRQPGTHCSLLIALEEYRNPPKIVILRGEQTALSTWQHALASHAPHTLSIALPAETTDLPDSLNKPLPADGKISAWVCETGRCLPAIHRLDLLLDTIREKGSTP